jgi:KipI family sensor histidine kinase inhibitor
MRPALSCVPSPDAGVRIVRYGERALLVDLPDLDVVLALYEALREVAPPGVCDLVPGARSLLIVLGDQADRAALAATIRAAAARPRRPDAGATPVEVPVVYDGPDVEEVAHATGLTSAEVVERHAAGSYVVGFCGFVPGFAYLTGLDPVLHVPRRGTPRARVPAGAVAIAGEFAGIYPRAAPGGWRLLGHTGLRLFDVDRDPPALLRPGAPVLFRPISP